MRNGQRRRASAHPKRRSQKSRDPQPGSESTDKLFAFTINPKTAEIVKLESLDPSGARHELSDAEKTSLAGAKAEEEIEDIVEQVFEAGIACVLGDEDSEHSEESAEEAELRHLLLTPLIEESPVQRLIEREALRRAILGTLIRNSIGSNAPPRSSQASSASEAADRS
jgi:hypothetical protein